jgi:hypothetical protein
MINILRELCRTKKGRVEGVSMADMLQMIWQEKMTCRLLVKSDGKLGTLSILDGEMKSAKTKTHREQEAAMEILTWENVTIELDENPTPPNHTLKVSTEAILLENIRRREDIKEDTGKFKITNIERQKKEWDKEIRMNEWDKEIRMNVSKLNKSIATLKENLNGALLSVDIFGTDDMHSVAGFNSNQTTCALFGQIIIKTNRALKDLGFPIMGKYSLVDLVDAKMIVLIPMGNYAWGMLLDGNKAQLGLLLNVALPKAIAAFQDAIISN